MRTRGRDPSASPRGKHALSSTGRTLRATSTARGDGGGRSAAQRKTSSSSSAGRAQQHYT
eukprot:5709602-Prymnesium_polylepis.1